MAHDEPTVVFLDANVLAKPVTRTLILRCSAGGYVARWSRAAEAEANRHLSGRRMSVTELREIVGLTLSGSARSIDRFKSTPLADRQILADAEVGQATFLVTEDVDDFAPGDLDLAGVTAINPDLFLAERAQRSIYLQALETMVSGMRDPTRTPAELHSAIARQHPRLFHRFRDLFDVEPESTGHRESRVLFRGTRCIRCAGDLRKAPSETEWLCRECVYDEQGGM